MPCINTWTISRKRFRRYYFSYKTKCCTQKKKTHSLSGISRCVITFCLLIVNLLDHTVSAFERSTYFNLSNHTYFEIIYFSFNVSLKTFDFPLLQVDKLFYYCQIKVGTIRDIHFLYFVWYSHIVKGKLSYWSQRFFLDKNLWFCVLYSSFHTLRPTRLINSIFCYHFIAWEKISRG